MREEDSAKKPTEGSAQEEERVGRKPYEKPRLRKHGQVQKVTLFSAGGVPAGGLTATGAPGRFPEREP